MQHAKRVIEEQHGPEVPPFWQEQYRNKAGMYWHKFYQRNQTNFYKDRHYLHVVFPELSPEHPWPDRQPHEHVRLMEVTATGNAQPVRLSHRGNVLP